MSECQIENGVKCVTHDSYDVRLRCSALERDLATSKGQATYWLEMCHEARVDLAAAQAQVAVLEEANRVWDKTSLVQIVKERKAWEETAAQHCRNEFYYRGLVVAIGELFGIEAKTCDDGSVQEDVLCAKVPELCAELKARVAVLTEALTQYQEVIGECTKRMTRTQLREFVSLMDDGNLTLLHLNDKARNALTPAKETT